MLHPRANKNRLQANGTEGVEDYHRLNHNTKKKPLSEKITKNKAKERILRR